MHGRRVRGWVVDDAVEPPAGLKLSPIAKVSGWGPPGDIIDLAEWAAWRWAGSRVAFMRTASPDTAVRALPMERRGVPSPVAATATAPELARQVDEAFAAGAAVLRIAPGVDTFAVALAAAARGDALILTPSQAGARHLGLRLRRAGVKVASTPNDWASARAGATVVGARAAAWAPMPALAAVVVLDEHDEAYQQEQAPTWHARDVVVERARRAGVPAVVVSPMPSLEALSWGKLIAPSRSAERAGWPIVDVIDRRDEEPSRAGLYSPQLAQILSAHKRVVCVLNRRGRSRLLACTACGEIAQCEACDTAVGLSPSDELVCPRCGRIRPVVCARCGSTRLKNLRAGVSRVREELEALAGTPVVEVTAETAGSRLSEARVYVGTEAVLHQVADAEVVVFLDFDQELLAPRYRAAEEALALLVRAGRLVGGRAGGGRVVLQTRLAHHEVVQACLHADPTRVTRAEEARRELLRFPPASTLAVVSGPAGPGFVEEFGKPVGVEVLGPSEGRWLLRSREESTLLDALAATRRPGGRVRVAVDPMRF